MKKNSPFYLRIQKVSKQSLLFSTLLLVINTARAQYCTSGLTSANYCSPTSEYISNVTILNTFLNNSSGCNYISGIGDYTQFGPGPGTTAALTQGATYSIQVTTNGTAIESVWIDFDQDLTFSASEWIQPTTSSTASVATTATFTVPTGAITGTTGLRVRSRYIGNPNGSGDACTTFASGETEDYVVTILSTSTCTGTPANAILSPSVSCPGMTTITFTDIATYPGLTFQWYSSTSATGTYSLISGATQPFYSSPVYTSSPSWFKATVTCTSSALTSTLAAVQVTATYNNPNASCYCSSGSSNVYQMEDEIFNVMLNGNETPAAYSFVNACVVPAPGAGSQLGSYSNFTSLGALSNVLIGASNTFSVYESSCVNNSANAAAIWIDFNLNGVFTDPGEQVYVENALTVGPRNIAGSFTAPAGISPGLRTMRVIVATAVYGSSLTPCLNYAYGETEDYFVNLVAATPCSGTPSTNFISVSAPGCPLSGGSLSFINSPNSYTNSGMTYKWYVSTSAAGTYSLVSGATLPFYNTGPLSGLSPTWYKATVTCTSSASTITLTAKQVSLTLLNCYCSALPYTILFESIYNVMVNGDVTNSAYSFNNGCTNTAPGSGSQLGQYSNFTSLGALTNVYGGGSVNTFSLAEDQCAGGTYLANTLNMWIDFNQNGSFTDPGEAVHVENTTSPGPRTVASTFTVPLGSPTGTTVMRVILANGAVGPCSSYVNGETEDYLVNIVNPAACSGSPAVSSISVSQPTVCSGQLSTLSLPVTTYSNTGIQYQWYSSSNSTGPFSAIVGAKSYSYTPPGSGSAVYYKATITCTNGAAPSVSTAVSSVQVYSTIINSIPYIETFEGITNYNDLPNCQWLATNLNLYTYTYLAPTTFGFNQSNHTPGGSKFASFQYGSLNDAFITNAFQLQSGITYSASVWYVSSNIGGWQNLSINVGTAQTVGSMTTIANVAAPVNTTYSQLGGTFTVASSGIYYLAVKDGSGGINGYMTIDDIELTIPCSVNPVTSVSSTSTSICAGSPVTLAFNGGAPLAGVVSYTWDSGIQNTGITVNPTMTTTYSVTSTSTVNCTGANVATISILVNPNPSISVNSGSICSAGPAFIITPSGAGVGGTYSVTGGNFVVAPLSSSVYSVTGTSIFGCPGDTVVAGVTVNASPTISVSNYSICIGDTVTIIASGASTYSLDGLAFTGNSYVAVPGLLGSTDFSITGTGADNCISANTVISQVMVFPNPTVTVTNSGLCSGNTATLNFSGAGANGTYNVITGASTLVPSGTVYTVMPANTTSYAVTGITSDGCMDTGVLLISVRSTPTITVLSSKVTNTFCLGESVSLFAEGSLSYTWTLPNSTQVQNSTLIVTPTVSTTYTVSSRGTDGCVGTSTVHQVVLVCTGIEAMAHLNNDLTVYPNPSNGELTIELKNGALKTFELSDVSGRVVFTMSSCADRTELNIQQVANGIYYLKVQTATASQLVKVVKQ